MNEEEFIKWKSGIFLMDSEFNEVCSWEEAFYGLDSEDGVIYTIDYNRVMEPMC